MTVRPVAVAAGVAIIVVAAISQAVSGASEEPRWADEFEGAASSPPAAHWKRLEGGGGWGNDELQTYTSRPENVALDGEGHLRITARREADGSYTSARLESTVAFTHGRAEARINAPAGQGLWSAFWTLGRDHERVGWPRAGEIDVMELLNDARTLNANVHLADPSAPGGRRQAPGTVTPSEPLAGSWHVYAVEWSPDAVAFSLDGKEYHRVERRQLGDARWPFDGPQVLLLNLAVGGSWPGPPDDATRFPAALLVDYVRVYASSAP